VLGLADSYYNKGDYANAFMQYKTLITTGVKKEIILNAINGIDWSSRQDRSLNLIASIEELIQKTSDKWIISQLLIRKLDYHQLNSEWDQLDTTYEKILKFDPDYINDVEFSLNVANAYMAGGKYEKSDAIYNRISKNNPGADVFRNWAKLKILQNQKTEALAKYKEAVKLNDDAEIQLEKLNLQIVLNDKDFEIDYLRFIRKADGLFLEQGKILYISWLTENNKLTQAEEINQSVAESEFEIIRANHQYFKGMILYKYSNYEEAIPELLRVRYLYPKQTEIRLKADVMACYAYLKSKKADKAVQLFDSIKGELDEESATELEKAVKAGVQ